MLPSSSYRRLSARAGGLALNTRTTSPGRHAFNCLAASIILLAAGAAHAQTQTQTATPLFGVLPARYLSAQTVSITDGTPGAIIYYTTNGSYPNTTSAVYSGPITVSQSEILVAFAVAPGFANSPFATAEYIIGSSSDRFMYTAAGNGVWGFDGDGSPAPAALLGSPYGAIADSQGNVYIADSYNHRIRKVDATTGVITTVAGNGTASDTGDGGLATSATLWTPAFLALDNLGNLYVAEIGDWVVRKINLSSGVITRAAGDPTGTATTGPATTIPLGDLTGIACDSAGNLYIGLETEILAVDTFGNATLVAATGLTSNFPTVQFGGFAMDANHNFFLVALGSAKIYKLSSGTITLYAGTGLAQGGDGGLAINAGFGFELGLAVDTAGDLYVGDASDYAVREINAQTGIINTVAGVFFDPFAAGGDGDPATSSPLVWPNYLSVDANGNIYVVNGSSSIKKITAPATPPTALAPSPVFNPSSATFATPEAITITDAVPQAAIYPSFSGPPYTTQTGYHGPINVTGSDTLQAIAAAPGYLKSPVASGSFTLTQAPAAIIYTVAGNGTSGPIVSGELATNTPIGNPNAVAFRSDGGFYIADEYKNVVWSVSAGTGIITVVAGNGTAGFSGDTGSATSAELNVPQGVAVDASGNLYIADSFNHRIRKVAVGTGIITTIAGPGTYGTEGDGGLATSAYLGNPAALAVDKQNNLYIADSGDNRVRVVALGTGIISTIAGGGTASAPGYGDGGPATSASVSPVAIALDASDNLFLADEIVGRVRTVNATTHVITTIAGGGTGQLTDGVPATSVDIGPRGVALDPQHNVYFTDVRATIREILPNGNIATLAGNTYFGYSGDTGSATMASLYLPQQIAFDPSGNLYIADSEGVVRKVTFTASLPSPYFSLAGGTYHSPQTLTLTDTFSGTTIYYTYTANGSTPTTASTVYTGPIPINNTGIVEAIASVPGRTQSPISSKAYTYVPWPPAAAPYFSLAGGAYNAPQSLTLTDSTPGATIYYTTNGSTPTASSTLYTAPITIQSTETIKAAAIAPNYLISPISSKAYAYVAAPLAAPPYFSLAGGHYTTPQTLTLTDTTPGAVIYYTTNGTPPNTSSTRYTGPITISTSELIEAIAVAPGYTNSNPSSKAYTIP